MQPRRLALQLTPLLDLLLIVIFAQYLEVRENQAAIEQTTQSAVIERDDALNRLATLEEQINVLRAELAHTESRAQQAEGNQAQLQRQIEQIRDDLDRTLMQHRVLGELVVELFQIPPEDVKQILNPRNDPPPEQLKRLQEKFRDFSMRRAGQMIEHLLSYDEIRKRTDVWKVHIDADHIATLENGRYVDRIRLLDPNGDIDIDRFRTDFMNWYRTMPQPKGLVFILLTRDRRTTTYVTDKILKELSTLALRLQNENAGRSSFEIADLGFRIE